MLMPQRKPYPKESRAPFCLPPEELEKIDMLAEKKRLNHSAILRQAVVALLDGQNVAA